VLPTFGGENTMRGFYKGRFRDKLAYFIQGEYRFHIFWRISAALFGGLGQASERITLFAFDQTKFAYGFGFRFMLIPEERILGRLDLGFSKYDTQFYLSFSEAF
jgi:hypothetical protein